MRSLTSNALAKIAQATGTEPIVIIAISWFGNTFTYYCDKDYENIPGKIISVSALDEIINLQLSQTTEEINIVLDDTDGSIKALMDTYDVHRRDCFVYQCYADLAFNDRFEIFRGEIASPIIWSEAERTVKFTVLSRMVTAEVGFTPEMGQFASVPIDLTGKPWPLCFGGVVHVPAAKRAQVITGTSGSIFGLADQTLPARDFLLNYQLKTCRQAYEFYSNLITNLQLMTLRLYYTEIELGSDGFVGTFELFYGTQSLGVFDQDVNNEKLSEAFNDLAEVDGNSLKDGFVIAFTSNTPNSVTVQTISEDLDDSIDNVSIIPTEVNYRGQSINDPLKIQNLIDNNAFDLQNDYINHIITEDQLRQHIEDLVVIIKVMDSQVQLALQAYNTAAAISDPTLNAKKQTAKDVQSARDNYLESLKNAQTSLRENKYKKKMTEIDAHNTKYIFSAIGRIREKISDIITYMDLLLQSKQYLQQAQTQQNQLLNAAQAFVSGGYKFPQNQPVLLDIGGVVTSGFFNNSIFSIQGYNPTFTNIIVLPFQVENPPPNIFWINDPNIILNGMYCLLGDGRIIQVTDQTGNQCTFQLMQVDPSHQRMQEQHVVFNGPNSAAIREGLSNLLVGGESDFQLEIIANSVPYDISPEALKKLTGQATVQVLHSTGTAGTFIIKYRDFITSRIPYNATAGQVDIALSILLEEVNDGYLGPDDIQVTGGPLPNHDITITTDKPVVFQFTTDSSDLGDATQGVAINLTGTPDSEFNVVGLLVNGKRVGNFTTNDPGSTVRDLLLNDWVDANGNEVTSIFENEDIDVSGGPLTDADIQIAILNDGDYDFTLDSSGLTKAEDSNDPCFVVVTGIETAMASIQVISDGANEYTINQKATKLNSLVQHSQFAKGITEAKTKVIEAMVQLNNPSTNNDARIAAQLAVTENLSNYKNLISKVRVPQSLLEELNRLISDQEYKVLFELELLNYLYWRRQFTPITAKIPTAEEAYYITGADVTDVGIIAAAPVIMPNWVNTILTSSFSDPNDAEQDIVNRILQLPQTQAWIVNPGAVIKTYGAFQEIWVANLLPSTVNAVYAYRNIGGDRFLVPVPSRYYVINGADNYGLFTATTITMVRPLTDYAFEGWEDGIYVTLTSSIGPNICDIISWIVGTFTNLTVDAGTFSTVHAQVAAYPANFALLQKAECIQLINDIAYQSRCATWVKGGTVFIRYLSTEPTPIDTITEDDVLDGSMELTYTRTEDIKTVMIANWRDTYIVENPYSLFLRANLGKYPRTIEQYDYFIYNNFNLVYKSATYWMLRKSNTWKRAKFNLFLTKLALETWDCITLNFSHNFYTNGPINAIIEKAEYDSETATIAVECWLPVLAGQMSEFAFAWSGDSNQVYPPIDIITSGNAGNSIGGQVPTGSLWNPFDPSLANLRPQDYGDAKPGDSGDTAPANPAEEYEETDYSAATVANFEPPAPISLTGVDNRYFASISDNDFNDNTEDTYSPLLKIFFGIVKGYTSQSAVMPDDAKTDSTLQVNHQYYTVRGPDKRDYTVEQLQIDSTDRIPNETVVLCVYNEYSNQYEMQVPVWLADPVSGLTS